MHSSIINPNLSLKMWEIEHEIFNTIFALKIIALKIFGSDKVMVPIINKFDSTIKSTSFSSFVMPFIIS